MGEGAAFLLFAASKNHATSETLRWAKRMGSTLSVTALPCHLSRKGEALAGAESLQLNGRLLFVVK